MDLFLDPRIIKTWKYFYIEVLPHLHLWCGDSERLGKGKQFDEAKKRESLDRFIAVSVFVCLYILIFWLSSTNSYSDTVTRALSRNHSFSKNRKHLTNACGFHESTVWNAQCGTLIWFPRELVSFTNQREPVYPWTCPVVVVVMRSWKAPRRDCAMCN